VITIEKTGIEYKSIILAKFKAKENKSKAIITDKLYFDEDGILFCNNKPVFENNDTRCIYICSECYNFIYKEATSIAYIRQHIIYTCNNKNCQRILRENNNYLGIK
jgi:hypothetical protein